MKLYTFSGGDSSSDNGSFVILVGEHRKDLARKEAEDHLKEMGREDLIPALHLTGMKDLDSSSILYTDVQGN